MFLNLSVAAIDTTRDLFTRYGFHLNSQAKEFIARSIAAVIHVLFTTNKSVPIGLKWRDFKESDIQCYLADKQMSHLESTEVSGCSRTSQSNSYSNCDRMEHIRSDGRIKSSVANLELTSVLSQDNTYLNLEEELVGPKRDLTCHRKPFNDSLQINKLPSKRTRCQRLKLSKELLTAPSQPISYSSIGKNLKNCDLHFFYENIQSLTLNICSFVRQCNLY
jgi:hypothetical protein